MASAECSFLILATARTGSTMLESMLNSHPDAIVGGELLNHVLIEQSGEIYWPRKSTHHERVKNDERLKRLRSEDPVGFLSAIADLARSENYRVFGFKLLYDHGQQCAPAVEYLANLPELRIVHLKRRNQLKRIISLHRAMQTGKWMTVRGEGSRERKPMTLDFDQCLFEMRAAAKVERQYDRFFLRQDRLEIWYEDMIGNPVVWGRRVQDFLGLESRELDAKTVKTGGGTLRDSIANYDELKSKFASTEWSHLFIE